MDTDTHTYTSTYIGTWIDIHTYIHMEVEEAITTISRNQQHASNTHTHTQTLEHQDLC